MVISTYQVSNVLRVYGDQLKQTTASHRPERSDACLPDRVSISAGANRRAFVNKIAEEIVKRLAEYGSHDDVEKEVFEELENEFGAHLAIAPKTPNQLIFKIIDENREEIKSLSLEGSKFLRYKLREITREGINENVI